MKKIVFYLMSVMLMIACSSDEVNPNVPEEKETRSTEVKVMGEDLTATTRAGAVTPAWADAYFYVRIDGRIPAEEDEGNVSSEEYIPLSANGQSVFADANKGRVNKNYPCWKMYYGGNGTTKQYVYDTTGNATLAALDVDKIPTFESLVSVNMYRNDYFSNIDMEGKKIIWYVVKFSYGKWHVDGILTYDWVEDASLIPDFEPEDGMFDSANGNIEVDIHQQEHGTWDEIKTSLHIRDIVDKVVIEIPLEAANVAETEDFVLRTYDKTAPNSHLYINGKEYALDSNNPVKVTIEHRADKVVITVECKDARYLQALREEYGDGVTVEVSTYPKNLTNKEVWDRLKQAEVTVENPEPYEGLIFNGPTSAFFNE